MVKNFLDMVEVTNQTESGIQVAKVKLIVPTASVNASSSGIIIPNSSGDLVEAIADSKFRNIL